MTELHSCPSNVFMVPVSPFAKILSYRIRASSRMENAKLKSSSSSSSCPFATAPAPPASSSSSSSESSASPPNINLGLWDAFETDALADEVAKKME